MSSTGLDHPLVREYLDELDTVLHRRPVQHSSELMVQIISHLVDALSPDASAEDVAAILRQLGSPADLVAEAKGSIPADTPTTIAGIVRARLARVRRRTWIIAGAACLVVATAVATYIAVIPSGSLQLAGQGGWWYLQDGNHEVDTQADNARQSTIRIRSGQRQGFAVGIYNPTNWTQTILGRPHGLNPAWDNPNGPFNVQLGVSVFNLDVDHGGFIRNIRFTLPGAIPPHQIRLLRITWISSACLPKGASQSIDSLSLRVRIGWFTRTEVIPLDQAWALAGPSHGRCT